MSQNIQKLTKKIIFYLIVIMILIISIGQSSLWIDEGIRMI